MTESIVNKFTKKDALKWAVTIIATLLVFLIPISNGFTSDMRKFLLITVFAIFALALEILPQTVTVVSFPILYILAKFTDTTVKVAEGAPKAIIGANVILGAWTADILWLMFAGFVFSAAMLKTGLMKRVSYACIKLLGGSFTGILFGITASAMVLAPIITDSGARAILFMTFGFGICQALDLKANSKEAIAILIISASSSFIAGMAYLTSANENLLFFRQIEETVKAAGVAFKVPNYLEFLQQAWLPAAMVNFATAFVFSIFYKPSKDFKILDHITEERAKLGSITVREIKLLVILLGILVLLLTQSIHKVAVGWIFALGAMLTFFPFIDICEKGDFKKINYDILIYVAACLSIGTVSTKLGFSKVITGAIAPLLGGNIFWTIFAVIIFSFVINMLLTPLACAASMSGPLTSVALSLGVSPAIFAYTFNAGLMQVILPYEFALTMYLFGFGMMSVKNFAKAGILRTIVYIVVWMALVVPYWMIIGLA